MANVTALATWIAAESRGMRFNLPQGHPKRRRATRSGKRAFFFRGGPMDFSCASCHGEDGKRIRLQDLPNLTKNPGDGIGFAAWPAYRVSNGQMWSMQLRLNDCYRQQRFPVPRLRLGRDHRAGHLHGRQRQGRRVDRAGHQALKQRSTT
jgi:L-cysteine S-thiosulfotransferase